MQPEEPIEEAAEPAETGEDAEQLENALAQIEQQIQAKIPEQDRNAVQRIVLAGKKWMFSPNTRDIALQKIKVDDPDSVGMGIAALMSILQKASKGMPPTAIMPAAYLLLVEALRLIQDAGIAEVTPDFIADAAQALMGYMMQKAGVKPPDDALKVGAPPVSQAQPQGGGLVAAARGGQV